MLEHTYRALDLTDVKGAFCGKMLAELGIDVLKVEPPEGSDERRLAPFYQDDPHRENSLYWFAYNTGKRGITLNLATADGRQLFRRLAERADFVVESFAPGYLDRLGLGYEALHALNPGLIHVSITPFGQSGPYAGFAADDLTILALSGTLNQNGDLDRAPLRFRVEQTYPQAGAQAAAAAMIAHHYRRRTGRGQHVDVSMQEAMAQANWLQYQYWFHKHIVQTREGSATRRGDVLLRIVFPCRDGHVSWRIFVANQGGKTKALTDWMAEEGSTASACRVNWEALDMDDLTQDDIERWETEIAEFLLTRTKAELHWGAIKRGIMLFPMSTPLDLLEDKHLVARDFWAPVEHTALGATIRYPGLPYKSTAPLPPKPRRAPLLGEHNEEVYLGELGLARAELATLKQAGVM